jgi:hypothetical protein
VHGRQSVNAAEAGGAVAAHTGTTSVALPAVTAVAANTLLLEMVITNNTDSNVPVTSPAGSTTTVGTANVVNGANTTIVWAGQEAISASGSTGTRTPTLSPGGNNSGGMMVTLAPAIPARGGTTMMMGV